MGCLCRNFHMLCDRQFQYTLVLRYICVKNDNVHRKKKCSVFHICLFSERHDFCDFDIGCSRVSTNFVKHRTRFHWIIKRKPNIHVLTRGWVKISNLALGVGQSFLCRREGVGLAFYINHISKCSGPPPILFDQSLSRIMKNFFTITAAAVTQCEFSINMQI